MPTTLKAILSLTPCSSMHFFPRYSIALQVSTTPVQHLDSTTPVQHLDSTWSSQLNISSASAITSGQTSCIFKWNFHTFLLFFATTLLAQVLTPSTAKGLMPVILKELFAQFAIQIDERSFYGPAKEQNPKPSSFEKDGTVIYPFKDKDGHCYFDVCSCAACNEASYESDEDIRIRRRKEKDPLYKRYLEGDTSVGPLGERKYNFIVQYSDKKEEPRQQIMMINPDEFPPQEDFLKNNISHCPKILSQAVDSFGPNQLSQAEKVLNWQTENSLAQNQLLSIINHKVDQLAEGYNSRLLSLQNSITEIHGRLSSLHQEMMTMAKHMMANTTQFRNKKSRDD
ncbi:hypothetical protein DY000_02022617 [Brassica cretica]|uniref:Uncharacterized protein n=1 Tax=Brassica cretica TaxID=69181 RepID=A0ABQ7E7G7_BRACR|nr:hypothetical protein DY000_02022617 [Brassica cretica]